MARGRSMYQVCCGSDTVTTRRRPRLTLALDSYSAKDFRSAIPAPYLDWIVYEADRRREVRLMLAIEASKLQHGRMPKTLDELVGPYLKDLPHDPYTGEPFRYFPEGLSGPSGLGLSRRQSPTVTLEAHTPFLWSAGTRVRLSDSS